METRQELLAKLAELDRLEQKNIGTSETLKGVIGQTSNTLAYVFSWLGGLLALTGILYFLLENWSSFGSNTRVIIAFTALVVAHVSGVLISKVGNPAGAGTAFHLMGMILFPTAIGILLYENKNILTIIDIEKWPIIISGLCAVVYGLVGYVGKRGVFVFGATLYAYGLYSSVIQYIYTDSFRISSDMVLYAQLIFGLSLVLWAYVLYVRKNVTLWVPEGILLVGSVILAIVPVTFFDFSLFGSSSPQMNVWEGTYPILVGLIFYVGIYFRLRLLLVVGVLSMFTWIGIMLAKFDAFSAPLILALSGVVLVLIAIIIFKMKKHA